MEKTNETKLIDLGFTDKDKINAMITGKKYNDFLGKELTIKGVYQFEDEVADKETGESSKKVLTAINTGNEIIVSPSPTFKNSVEKIYSVLGKNFVGTKIKLVENKSSAGRKFLQMELA